MSSEAWSDLREGAIRKFCFVEIDLAGHSAIAANNSTRDAELTFGAFLDYIEEKANALGGHAWGLAGDGGLFAFYDDDVTTMAEQATAAALSIVDGLEEFNKTKSKVKQQVRARIAVHVGDARYSSRRAASRATISILSPTSKRPPRNRTPCPSPRMSTGN